MADRDLRHILDVHDVMARIYSDTRFRRRDLRLLAVTAVWVVGIERPPYGHRWQRVCEIMDLSVPRFWALIAEDVPRYEPPHDTGDCEAPMQRREGLCGVRGQTGFRITDPADGTWRIASYCRRHLGLARQLFAEEQARWKAGGIPESMPNAGGLLPCYVRWSWPERYAQARPGWTPPAAGPCADDWPVTEKVITAAPKLSIVAGAGESVPGDPPLLRLIT